LTVFQQVVNTPSLRGLIVTIEKETLTSRQTLPSNGTFEEDLHQLDSLLKDNEAAYVILRRRDSGPAPFVSIAYVPDTANVRQKMLFASTRNTLLRELGTEKFGESLFATMKEELTAEGFRKHDIHEAKYEFSLPDSVQEVLMDV
jgi:twinfilin-like protein